MYHREVVPYPVKAHAKQRVFMRLGVICTLTAAGAMIAAVPAEARITRVTVTGTQSPTFGGFVFPGVGQYERISGKAFGEINQNNPQKDVIVDIRLETRNEK